MRIGGISKDESWLPDGYKGNVVYFFHRVNSGLIKIGCTSNLSQRYHHFHSNGNPVIVLGAMNGSYKLEHQIQREWSEFCSYGEWFYAHPVLTGWIEDRSDYDVVYDCDYLHISEIPRCIQIMARQKEWRDRRRNLNPIVLKPRIKVTCSNMYLHR